MTFEDMQRLVVLPGQAHDMKALVDMIPELALLEATPQEPSYHGEGNVFIHTNMVLEAMINGVDYQSANENERFVLFYSALLHDIAKPATTQIDPVTGKIGQPGHSRRGAIDARIMLWRAGVPFGLREEICRIISVHQLPFFALAGDKRSGKSAEFLIHKLSCEQQIWMLCAMATADMEGRVYHDKRGVLADIELFRMLAEEEDCLRTPKQFADQYTKHCYLKGASISPDYPFFRERKGSDVVVMCGLPASGKNHWVSQNLAGLPVVSVDDAREEMGLRYGKNNGAAVHYAFDKARDLLRRHEPFVWNTTLLSSQMRSQTLDFLHDRHADVRLVYLEQPEKVIYQRNNQRDSTLNNERIREMLFRWEVPLPTEASLVEYRINESARRPSVENFPER
jgi:predicted kinase